MPALRQAPLPKLNNCIGPASPITPIARNAYLWYHDRVVAGKCAVAGMPWNAARISRKSKHAKSNRRNADVLFLLGGRAGLGGRHCPRAGQGGIAGRAVPHSARENAAISWRSWPHCRSNIARPTKTNAPTSNRNGRTWSPRAKRSSRNSSRPPKKAYQEAPNADKEIVKFLVRLLDEDVRADDYEPAAKIGKLLMDNKCDVKEVANLAGIAAFATCDFATAEKYLGLAESQGYYKSAPKEDEVAKIGEFYLQAIPYYKKAWAREKAFRARDAKADLPHVVLKTNKGEIELELFEDQAPNTVANFVSLVQSGFYKNVTFHRVLKGFMAQGGDPTGRGERRARLYHRLTNVT